MYAVEVCHLTYRYPSADEDCLKDVSLLIPQGELCAIIGSNGGGKSTLCHCLRGFIPALYGGDMSGDVKIMGTSISDMSNEELGPRVGLVFQNPFTQSSGIKDTVFEEIAFILENRGVERNEIIRCVSEVIELLGIENLQWRHPMMLSGGQRQYVALASVLVGDPDILVIDEPTSQLDPRSTDEVFAIIETMKKKKKTIVLVEHKADVIARCADHVVCLEGGQILKDGTPREVFTDPIVTNKEVSIPQVARLGLRLQEEGLPLNAIPITIEEAKNRMSFLVSHNKERNV